MKSPQIYVHLRNIPYSAKLLRVPCFMCRQNGIPVVQSLSVLLRGAEGGVSEAIKSMSVIFLSRITGICACASCLVRQGQKVSHVLYYFSGRGNLTIRLYVSAYFHE